MKHKILVLDDDQGIRSNLEIYLSDEGYETTGFESAETALENIEPYKYHLAIVDIRLPGMQGSDFIKKAYHKDKQLKYIIYTGSIDFKIMDDLLNYNITKNDIIYKPINDMNEILMKIKGILS